MYPLIEYNMLQHMNPISYQCPNSLLSPNQNKLRETNHILHLWQLVIVEKSIIDQ